MSCYLVDDILYGGSHSNCQYAMEAASHELLSASHYLTKLQAIQSHIIPILQTLVDFKGLRIVAMPFIGSWEAFSSVWIIRWGEIHQGG